MPKKILISETHLTVRNTLERMVCELGHEPIMARVPMPLQFHDADVFIANTSETLGITRLQAAHHADPSLPIIGIGQEPPSADELALLEIRLVVWLAMPFTLTQLRLAIELALAQSA
jgi:hypothetical protein